jgi:uncharacterized membrane protein
MGAILVGGAVILIWLIGTPDGLLGKADAIGYAVCHRIDLRSFHLGDRALPLCARCSGMYLGVLVSIAYFAIRRRKAALFPPRSLILILGIIFVGYVIDGVNSYIHLLPLGSGLYEPTNFLRLTTGFLFGIVLSSFVFPAFNQAVWREPTYEPALRTFKDLFILIGAGSIVIILVMVENPIFLYPLAILSSLTVLILLTIVYTMMLLLVFKRENRANNLNDLTIVIFVGLTFSIVQIGLFDLVRYSIFGTWSGFNFG